ncbi:MAG TPA: hypothetical protein VLL72_01880, partial [Kiloniellales bacterium]|nr:hypothetical protein [Kiloniellales bacterium]
MIRARLFIRSIALSAALLAPAACGDLPRPYQPAEKTANPLIEHAQGAGVLVLPLTGDRPGLDREAGTGEPASLSDAVARALVAREVLASTTSRSLASRSLASRAEARPAGPDRLALEIEWGLRRPDGIVLGRYTLRDEVPAAAWQSGDPALLEALAEAAAPGIATLAGARPELAPEPVAIPGFPDARLVVPPLERAPGDGETALADALTAELERGGLPVAREARDNDLLVLGSVVLGPAGDDGLQDVTVRWRVARAADETELGGIEQRNRVPVGSLDG